MPFFSLAWRRLRTPTDVSSLDPALEGWEATRSLLTGGWYDMA